MVAQARWLVRNLGVALAYGLVAWGVWVLAAVVGPGVWEQVWLPAGVALAAILVCGPGVWPGLLLGGVAAHVAVGLGPLSSLLVAAGNVAAALLGAWLVRRLVGWPLPFHRPGAALGLLGAAALGSGVSAAPLAVVLFHGAEGLPGGGALNGPLWAWGQWMLGNTAGVLLVAPTILLWRADDSAPLPWRRWLEAFLIAGVTLLVSGVAFGLLAPGVTANAPLAFLPIPFVALAAFRAGLRAALPLALMVLWVVSLLTALGSGPFAHAPDSPAAGLLLQAYGVVLALTALLIGAGAREGERLRGSLEATLGGLEDRIRERTRALITTNTRLERETREHSRTAMISHGRSQVLELLAMGAPLDEVLRRLVAVIEDAHAGCCALIALEQGAADVLDSRTGLIASTRGWAELRARLDGSPQDSDDALEAELAGLCCAGWEQLADRVGQVRLTDCRRVPIVGREREALGAVVLVGSRELDDEPPADDLLAAAAHLVAVAIERRQSERRLSDLASHDSVTGLLNRSAFVDGLRRAVSRIEREGGRAALMYLDLDGFKAVNDAAGHAVGDQLLTAVAARLGAHVRANDLLARVGGDEFTLLMAPADDGDAILGMANKLLAVVREPYALAQGCWQIGASIGVAVFPDDAAGVDELTRNADRALYRAKEGGRGRVEFSNEAVNRAANARGELIDAIGGALERGELTLGYRPRWRVTDSILAALDASVCWHHPDRGLLEGDAFLSEAEAVGVALRIADWALEAACRDAMQFPPEGRAVPVSVGLSRAHLGQRDLQGRILRVLSVTGLDADRLTLRLPGNALVRESRDTAANLDALQRAGIRFLVEGVGEAPLPLAAVARDGVVALMLATDYASRAAGEGAARRLVGATAALGRELGIAVVVPDIDRGGSSFSSGLGVDQWQGRMVTDPLSLLASSQDEAMAGAVDDRVADGMSTRLVAGDTRLGDDDD